jgi:asparagine synthase (glutamine-hydrolysing)
MCGISAIYRYTSITETDRQKLHVMNEEMHYRGPDDRGVWTDDHCGLAQVRLSIIGLEKGKQPLFNEDKSLVLVCNGEIYNYIELKQDLIKKGHYFNSDSDSETILHLYEEYGAKCLDYLRGMFSFCLWDSRKKQLFAARDRIGEKTLYFAQVPCGIVFSSELKAILKNYIENPQVSLEQLAEPIRFTSPVDKSNTFIEQIKRFEPGHYILVNETGLHKYQYWNRNVDDTFSGSFTEAMNSTFRLMQESVDICLRSDVPVAVMLSGGIDSSSIAAMAKETGREVHTITAGYKGQHDCDERDVAKIFAKEKGFVYHEIELDENDFKDSFDEFTRYMDEPVTDFAAFAQWALYKKVKNLGFKVLLGGMGGDELFYGYGYWNELAESLTIHRKHQSLFPWKGMEKKKEYLQFLLKNWKYVLYAGYPKKISDSSINFWMYDDYKKFARDASFEWDDRKYSFNESDIHFSFGDTLPGRELDYIYRFLFDKTMIMAYLYLSDRLGMGNSVEVRSPLLDYKLVEFVSSLPKNLKYRKDNPKFFLKEIMKGIVPDYILHAPKRGFTPPVQFVKDCTQNYDYRFFKADYKFYNSVLADRILSLNLKKQN